MKRTLILSIAVVVVGGGVVTGLAWRFGWPPFGITQVKEIKVSNPDAIENSPYLTFGDSDWPWWRGPNQDGVATGKLPPTNWSEIKNVVWKIQVPGRGHSSPIVVGDHVFLTTADEDAETMSLICYNRQDGKEKWATKVHSGGFMHTHPENSHASATPACDGERVFTAFMVQGGIWVSAVDLQGEFVWQKKVGVFRSKHGFGSSPVLFKSLVIIPADNLGGSYLVALDRESGKVEWLKNRPADASFGTPIVATLSDRDQLLLHGLKEVNSYDPVTGEVLWECLGPWTTVANTPAISENHVFVSGGYPRSGTMCIRADGVGNVSVKKVAWEKREVKFYVSSPLVLDGKLYGVTDRGEAMCMDARTGNEIWTQRLQMKFRASPIAIGDYVFFAGTRGETVVVKAGSQFEPVARNELDEGCMASPVICGGRLYLRTKDHLYCIGIE